MSFNDKKYVVQSDIKSNAKEHSCVSSHGHTSDEEIEDFSSSSNDSELDNRFAEM